MVGCSIEVPGSPSLSAHSGLWIPQDPGSTHTYKVHVLFAAELEFHVAAHLRTTLFGLKFHWACKASHTEVFFSAQRQQRAALGHPILYIGLGLEKYPKGNRKHPLSCFGVILSLVGVIKMAPSCPMSAVCGWLAIDRASSRLLLSPYLYRASGHCTPPEKIYSRHHVGLAYPRVGKEFACPFVLL